MYQNLEDKNLYFAYTMCLYVSYGPRVKNIISLSIHIILVFVMDRQCVKCALGNEICMVFVFGATAQWARASLFTRFLDHTQRLTTVCRTHLDT